jgi:hypothetical protein
MNVAMQQLTAQSAERGRLTSAVPPSAELTSAVYRGHAGRTPQTPVLRSRAPCSPPPRLTCFSSPPGEVPWSTQVRAPSDSSSRSDTGVPAPGSMDGSLCRLAPSHASAFFLSCACHVRQA